MANKNVLILTGVLVLGAVAVVFIDRGKGRTDDARVGQPILTSSASADIEKIDIFTGETKLALVRGADNVWQVGESAFPVDATKVAQFVDELTRSTYQNHVGSAKDEGEEFGITSATEVTLWTKGQKSLDLKLGNARNGGGQYVTSGDDRIYLVNNAINAQADQEPWEMKVLLNIPKDDVKSVTFTPLGPGRKPVTLSRETKDASLKIDGGQDSTVEVPQVKAQDSSFAGITFKKHYDPSNAEAQAALAKTSRASVTLFDGRRYTFDVGSIGEKTKKHFLKIHAEAPDGLGPDDKARLEALNELMSKNAFEVSETIAARFEKAQSDFAPAPATKG